VNIVVLAAFLIGAELNGLGADGWYTWRVDAAEGHGNWCCVTWNAGKATSRACDLDGRGLSINKDDSRPGTTGEIQIYAWIESGKARRIRALSPQCPVNTTQGITDLGRIDTDDSLDWLSARVGRDSDITSDSLLAISAHAGKRAVDTLVGVLENRQLNRKVRQEALFWLVQSDTDEAFDYLDRLFSNHR
jgi:hypothetical protein